MAKKPNPFSRRIRPSANSSGGRSSGAMGFSNIGVTIKPPCGEDATPVKIESSCDEPVFVEICPQSIGIETALAELGCILGDEGQIIGKVMLCKITEELTGVETIKVTAYYTDGTIEENYSGPWGVCENPQVDIEKFEYCNLETGTKWIRECQYITIGTVTTKNILDEFDTGFPCVDSIVIENEYCIIQ